MSIIGGSIIGGGSGSGVGIQVGAASGDTTGATDQATIEAAITSAGVGGKVVFKPGETYYVWSITPLEGQTWEMYGATIKRCDAVRVTGVTDAVDNQDIDLGTDAATAGFKIGMSVTIYDNTNTSSTDFSTKTHEITGISGDVLTVGDTFSTTKADMVTAGTGSYSVVTCGETIFLEDPVSGTIEDITFLGGVIDGNNSNNTYLTKWNCHVELYVGSDYKNFQSYGLTVKNATGDAIVYGGEGTRFINTKCMNSNGHAFHASGVGISADSGDEGAIITNPVLIDSKQAYVDGGAGDVTGHGVGAISYSENTGRVIYENIQVTGCLYGGIGGLSSSTNSETQFFNGYLKGCVDGDLVGINSGGGVSKIILDGLRIIGTNTATDIVRIGNSDSSPPTDVRLFNCMTEGCVLRIEGAEGVQCKGNSWDWSGAAGTGTITVLDDATNITIEDTIVGSTSNYAVVIAGTANNITLGGEILDFKRSAIRDQGNGANNIYKPSRIIEGTNFDTGTSTYPIDTTSAQTNSVIIRDIDFDFTTLAATQPLVRINAADNSVVTGCTMKHALGSTGDAVDLGASTNTCDVVLNFFDSTGTLTVADAGTSNVTTPNYTI